MPEVILNCQQCQRQLRVTDALIGKPVKCPACGLVFTVPLGIAEPPLAPVPVAPEVPTASDEPPEHWKEEEYYEEEPRSRRRRPAHWDYDRDPGRARGLLMPPAICLLILGILGILINLGQMGMALIPKPPPPANQAAPKDPWEAFQRGIEQGQTGPLPLVIGLVFVIVNFLILVGAIFMLRARLYGFAMTASILAIADLGNCCCLLGLPFGIWSLIILARPEVKRLFESTADGTP